MVRHVYSAVIEACKIQDVAIAMCNAVGDAMCSYVVLVNPMHP